jgi:hypothetical protein
LKDHGFHGSTAISSIETTRIHFVRMNPRTVRSGASQWYDAVIVGSGTL